MIFKITEKELELKINQENLFNSIKKDYFENILVEINEINFNIYSKLNTIFNSVDWDNILEKKEIFLVEERVTSMLE